MTTPTKKTQVTIMSRTAFEKLLEYSTSIPTGLPIGKKWRARREHGTWELAEVTKHTHDAERDQFDRPLYPGTRTPMGRPGEKVTTAHIRWTRIAILRDGKAENP